MPALAIEGVTKSFAGNVALRLSELAIDAGQIHAVLGQNGSGKSTLIKVLSGYHRPDDGGSVRIRDHRLPFGAPEASYRLGCRFVHQDLGLVMSESVLDNMLLGAGYPTRAGTIRTKKAITDTEIALANIGMGVSPSMRVELLAPSERTRVAVARALRNDAEHPPVVLVLDEPTATMPSNEVEQLLDTIRRVAANGVAVMFVTHQLEEVFSVADHVTVLRDGANVLSAPIEETDRATLAEVLVGGLGDETRVPRKPKRRPTVEACLSVDDLTAGPLQRISFRAHPGEILGFAGLTGSGRDTVLSAVFGGVPRDGGTVVVRGRQIAESRPPLAMAAGLAFLPAERITHGGAMTMSATENLTLTDLSRFWRGFRLHTREAADETRTWMNRLSVRPADGARKPLGSFSGGNQQKILFAKWLRTDPVAFLLDEPTQGVDIGGTQALHSQLRAAAERGMAIVVSSSDDDELAELCHRVIVLRAGITVSELAGERVAPSVIAHASHGTPAARPDHGKGV